MIKKIIYNLFNKLQDQAIEYRIKENAKKLNLHSSVKIYNSEINGNVSIGKFTYIAPWSIISTGKESTVTIGKYCAIGRYVSITSRGHSLRVPTSDENYTIHKDIEENTIIGNYVWIGDHVFIKHGIVIGDYAIVGAGSVVTKDVKPFEIVGGVPAKHIRFNTEHYKSMEVNSI